MVLITASSTLPINPPSTTPILSTSQIWQGLVQKCRHPQDFLAAMSDCEVIEENAQGLTRIVTFKEGMGPPAGKVEEKIVFVEGLKADFHMQTGSKVSNIISQGPSSPTELYLTFTWEWLHPEIEAGSEKEKEQKMMYQGTGGEAVASTIKSIREMVKEGKLRG
ncbi:MAG: hypothetical protein M1827_001177 [Pycnora praestabilis]|nr:MAG: hypothetical protein M1827_001177 [Pycnora praestabilis]